MSDALFGLPGFSESLPTAGLPVSQPEIDPLKWLTSSSVTGVDPSQPIPTTAGLQADLEQVLGQYRSDRRRLVSDTGSAIDPLTGTKTELDFTAGVFTARESTLTAEYLWDGGGYGNSQVGVFLLDGMESLTGDAFHREAAKRATSNSTSGYVLVDDRTEGAKLSGKLSFEDDFNQGPHGGVKSFTVKPGAKYGLVLIPDGSLADIAAGGFTGGSRRPLYSMATANPNGLFQAGQLVEAGSNPTRGNAYIFEDLRLDQGSDRDYNDLVIRLRGVSGYVPSINDYINPQKDWRKEEPGQLLINEAVPYVTVELPPTTTPATGAIDPVTGVATAMPTDSPLPSNLGAIAQPATQPVTSPLGAFPATYPTPEDVAAAAVAQIPANKFPIVGVIDTGFARSNPDLDYSKIVWGKDYIDNDADPLLNPGEGNEHGTHILGLISALRNNGVGIDGLAPDAPIWAARAVGSGNWAKALVDYVDYIKTKGQTRGLVNLSFDLTQKNADGTISTRYEFTPEERVAIEQARQAGVVLVVAAGNSGTGDMSVLAQAAQEFDNIISVAAAEQIDRSVAIADGAAKTDYSSSGQKLTLSAIGGTIEQGIPSLLEEGLGTMAGTSVATAKVTANAALAWAANPSLNYLQVKDVLTTTATDIEAPGYDELTGYGIVNGAAAISLAKITKGETYNPEPWFAPDSWSGEGFATPWEREVAALDSYAIRSNPSSSGYMERFLYDARWYQMSAEAIERDDVRRNFLGYSHATFRLFVDLVPPRISNDIRLVPVAYHAGVPYKWTTKSTSTLQAELGRDPTFDDLVRIARPDLVPGDPAYGAFAAFLIRQHKSRPVGGTETGQTGILSSSPLAYIPQPWTELTNFATLVPDTISLANSAYAKNGGYSQLGSPSLGTTLGKFESWQAGNFSPLTVKYQMFSGGSEGGGALVLNRAEDEAFWVKGRPWFDRYLFSGAPELGLPTSNRYSFGTGERQDFEKGAVFHLSSLILDVSGAAGEHYQKNLTNAQRNQLGMMTGSAISSGDGLIYPFTGGTLNYRYASGVSFEFNWANYPLVSNSNWISMGSVRLQNPPQPGTTAGLPNTAGAYQYSTRSANGAIAHYYANGNLQQQPNSTKIYWYQIPGTTQSSSTNPITTPTSTKLTPASALFDQPVISYESNAPASLNLYSSLKQGSLSSTNPDDLFYFDVTKPGEYVQWNAKTLSGNLRMQIIRDANNNNLLDANETVKTIPLGSNNSQSMTFENKGRYYIRLLPESGSSASYQLSAIGSPYRPLHHGADFNRDGLTDFAYQGKGAGNNSASVFTYGAAGGSLISKFADLRNDLDGSRVNLVWGDFNGDRRPDYIRQEKADWATWDNSRNPNNINGSNTTENNTELWLAGADGKSFYEERDLEAATGSGFNGNFVNLIPGDFNGDGKTDFIRQEKGAWDNDEIYTVEVWMNNDAANFSTDHSKKPTFGSDGFKGDYVNLIPGDFDGDGRTDLIRQEKNTWDGDGSNTAIVFLSNGDGQFRQGAVLNNSENDLMGDFTNLIPGDFNGDGKTDFIRQEKNTWDDDEGRTAEVWLSNGGMSQFTRVSTPLRHDGDDFKGSFVNIIPGDFNGDGRTDILRQEFGPRDQDNHRTAEIFLSNGDGTFSKNPQLIQYGNNYFKGTSTNILTGALGGTAPFYEHTDSRSGWVVEYHRWPSQDSKPVAPKDLDKERDDVLGSTRLDSNTRSDGKRGLQINWGSDAPDARVPNDHFAMRAYTQYSFEAGKTYVAKVKADDGYRLFAKHIGTNKWEDFMADGFRKDAYGAHKEIQFTVPQSGTYDFHFEFYDDTSDAYFDLTIDEVSHVETYYPNIESTLDEFFGNRANTSGEDWSQKSIDTMWDRISGESAQFGTRASSFYDSGDIWQQDSPEDILRIYDDLSRDILGSVKPLTTGYAYDRGYYSAYGAHSGLDIDTIRGDVIRSATRGKFAFAKHYQSPGNPNGWWIAIDEIDANDARTGRRWWYGHLGSSRFSSVGEIIERGTVIGDAGDESGYANHLHLMVVNTYGDPPTSWNEAVNGTGRGYAGDVQNVLERTMSPLQAYWESRNENGQPPGNTIQVPSGGTVSQAGLEFIARHEGLRLDLYNDPAGHCTIGVGHLVHRGNCNGSESTEFRNGITRDRALDLLNQDASGAANTVRQYVTVPLNQNQFDALVSFVFNVGSGNFQASNLLIRLNQGEYSAVPSELNRWNKAGGVVLPGLVTRRKEEGDLFTS
jgi:GH24 family phage-related lysozyme (muramidase)